MKYPCTVILLASVFVHLGPNAIAGDAPAECSLKKLRFSADIYHPIPSPGSNTIWGGNATMGRQVINPPFLDAFLSNSNAAKHNGLEVFGYLEGPCGNTGGHDDGERARCRTLHQEFNRIYAPETPDEDLVRWKPFTLAQMKASALYGVDYCEIDNLENTVVVPIIPIFKEIKALFDGGEIHCRLVLKNIRIADIEKIKREIAPTIADANFIAPFHIFEARDTSEKASLDLAMKNLKGPGAVTIISTNTNSYGSAFTDDEFLSCPN